MIDSNQEVMFRQMLKDLDDPVEEMPTGKTRFSK